MLGSLNRRLSRADRWIALSVVEHNSACASRLSVLDWKRDRSQSAFVCLESPNRDGVRPSRPKPRSGGAIASAFPACRAVPVNHLPQDRRGHIPIADKISIKEAVSVSPTSTTGLPIPPHGAREARVRWADDVSGRLAASHGTLMRTERARRQGTRAEKPRGAAARTGHSHRG
jgi:hypothetical protein